MPRCSVLFIHHANDMYGADVSLLHSVQALDSEKYHPIVILPADMPEGMLSTELDRIGVEHHFAPLGILRRKYLTATGLPRLLWEFVQGSLRVRALCRERNASVVYVNTIVVPAGAIGGKLAGKQVLWHVHEILSFSKPLRRVISATLSLCADRIVCVSAAVRDSLVRERPELASKAVIIFNAVELPGSEAPKHAVALRQEIGVDATVPMVGMVGRITHWKGQEILAEAAPLVLQRFPDAHFVAVGSYFADQAHYLEKLQERIHKLGIANRFHLLDYRSDVTSVYDGLDVFVLPSIKPEPFGRVTVEAMLHQCAVIATNHGGSPELLQDNVTGLLVPPSDPLALAAAIERLLIDPALRERLSTAAAAHAKQAFSMAGYKAQINGLIDALTTDCLAAVEGEK